MRTWATTFLETSIIILYSVVLFSFFCSSTPHKAHKHTFLRPRWKLSCYWSTSKCTLLPLAVTHFPISILNYVTTAQYLDFTRVFIFHQVPLLLFLHLKHLPDKPRQCDWRTSSCCCLFCSNKIKNWKNKLQGTHCGFITVYLPSVAIGRPLKFQGSMGVCRFDL